jgi:DNA uptake protein ComE-like DNA-binding protein
MKPLLLNSILATGLFLAAGLAMAQDPQPAVKPPQAVRSKSMAHPSRAIAKPKPALDMVDVNHASKADLKKLPGITDALADKIIAGRPYVSKSKLVTQKVVAEGIYMAIKDRIIAG